MNNRLTLHYVIAHMTLKNFVLKNGNDFIKIVAGGPDNLKSFLEALWKDIKTRNPDLRNINDNITKESFNVSMGIIDENTKLLTIVMPEVKEAPEATMIGVLLGGNLRYFTLEYDKSVVDQKETYMVCEWDKSGNHLNYGKTENTFNSFLGSIIKILGK